MKKLPLFIIAASCTTMASMSGSLAQTEASSKPMGYVTYSALGNSDTTVSLPIHRKAAFVGKVDSVSGTNEIVVQGTPGWTAGDFVYSAGVQTDTFYVLIASGNLEGRHFEVTANSANSLTIDVGTEVITGAGNVESNTSIQLIPFWTLNTAFPNGEGILPSANHFIRSSEVLTVRTTSAGINLPPNQTCYYYNGGADPLLHGWRIFPDRNTIQNDLPLSKDLPLTIRHNTAQGSSLTNLGDVPTTAYQAPLNRLTTGVKQDNAVALSIPLDVTLAGSNLIGSTAFEGSSNHFIRKDELLVFDNTAQLKNKPPLATYYYYTGAPVGWRKFPDRNTIVDTDVVFSLDKAVVIRRATGASGTTFWSMPLPYTP